MGQWAAMTRLDAASVCLVSLDSSVTAVWIDGCWCQDRVVKVTALTSFTVRSIDRCGGETGNTMCCLHGGETANGLYYLYGGEAGNTVCYLHGGAETGNRLDYLCSGETGNSLYYLCGVEIGNGLYSLCCAETGNRLYYLCGAETGNRLGYLCDAEAGNRLCYLCGAETGNGLYLPLGSWGGGGDKCEDPICVMRTPFMTHPQPVLYHDLSCWLPVFQSFDFSLSDICFFPFPLQSCIASFSKLFDSDVCLAYVCIQSVTTVFTFCWMTLTSLTVTWAPCDVSWLMCLWVWQPSTVWPSITTLWRSSGSVYTLCVVCFAV